MSRQIDIPEHILHEDDHILVINKPSGLMVEPDRNGYPNLQQQVKSYLRNSLPPGQEVYAQTYSSIRPPG